MRYRLEELFDLQMGKTPARANLSYWNGTNKWVSISDLSGYDKYVTDTKECISDLGVSESGIKAVPKNTVIMSFKLSIGKTAITTEDVYTNEAIMAFIDKGVCKINTDYLYYLFSGTDWNKGTNKAVLGLTLNKATLSKKEIDIPDLNIQIEVVKKLNSLSKVIQLHKHILDKLDELIKSRFVEMFGDVKTNRFHWKKCNFRDITTKITDGEHGTVPRVSENEGTLYLMARNVSHEGYIDLSETSFVPVEVHKKIYKRCNPEAGDILLVCVGATIGKCAIVPHNMGEFSMARSVALLKPNKKIVNSAFLYNLLKSDPIQHDIDNCAHAAAQAGLYTNMINSLDAFLPPLNCQNKFADFVIQVEKQKATVQQSIDKLETLKKSLTQDYFG